MGLKNAGIVVSNDSTLQITLTAPFPNFLYLLAMQYGFVYPKEAITKYGNDGMRLHFLTTKYFFNSISHFYRLNSYIFPIFS